MEKLCIACQTIKPANEFYSNKATKDGYSCYCRSCTRAKNAVYLLQPKRPRLPPAAPGMKRCNHCKLEKPFADFGNSKRTADGLERRCKPCNFEFHRAWRLKNLDKAAADQKRWREEHPEQTKDAARRHNYGVPMGWYAETLAAQNGKCAICGTAEPGGKGDFHVDHCHDTNRVRELLCSRCNLALGHFRHNPDIVEAAKQYLLKHQAKEGGV